MRADTHFKAKGVQMGTITEGIKDAVGFVFCSQVRAAQGIAGLLASLPIVPSVVQDIADRYRAFACGDDPLNSAPVGSPPPFTGGQCEGKFYQVTIDHEVSDGAGNRLADVVLIVNSIPAPISDVAIGDALGFAGSSLEVTHNQGTQVVASVGTNRLFTAINSIVVSRQDGLPDDCGDLPPSLPEPVEEVEDELDIVYDDPFGNPVNIPNVPIKFFKPCINLDGVRVPFEVDTPFGKICGKVGISPDFPDIIEPSVDIDLCPEQRRDLGYKEEEIKDFFDILEPIGDLSAPAVPSISGILTENYDLESLPILGVFVRGNPIDFGGNKTIVLNDDGATNPNIVIPRIGSVFFEYLIKTEGGYESAFSEDIPIKNANQFIPCPWIFGAIKVHFRREFNCKVAIVPVARKSCCDSCKGSDPNKGLDDLDRCRID